MSKVIVALEEEDILELQEVLLDEDQTAALEFLKTKVAPKIPGKGTSSCDSSHCNPYLFKADGPGQDRTKG